MLCAEEWEIEMEHNRRTEQRNREMQRYRREHSRFLLGIGVGLLITGSALFVAYLLIVWIRG